LKLVVPDFLTQITYMNVLIVGFRMAHVLSESNLLEYETPEYPACYDVVLV
jgi:hypothetical protein